MSFLPESLIPPDTVAYVGDSLESVYIVAWNVHQLFRAPLQLFDANVLHPLRARSRSPITGCCPRCWWRPFCG